MRPVPHSFFFVMHRSRTVIKVVHDTGTHNGLGYNRSTNVKRGMRINLASPPKLLPAPKPYYKKKNNNLHYSSSETEFFIEQKFIRKSSSFPETFTDKTPSPSTTTCTQRLRTQFQNKPWDYHLHQPS